MKIHIHPARAIALSLVFLAVVVAPSVAHEGHKKAPDTEPVRVSESAPVESPQSHSHAPSAEVVGHDDSKSEHHEASNLPQPLAWLGKFHPPATHFPIALLVAAAVGELLFIRRGSQEYRHAVRFCVRFGGLGALLAAALGWFFAGFRLVDEEWGMTAHRWAGTSAALLALALVVSLERAESSGDARRLFRGLLFSSASVVGATGFLGGALLYGIDHYAWWGSQ